MPRWRIGCSSCDVSAWVGPLESAGGRDESTEHDAWCESCQRGSRIAGAAGSCPSCGASLTTGAPRFAEIYGALQNLAAVLAAWDGDDDPLHDLLPERPRFLTDLDPPNLMPEDDAETRAALALLASGLYADARERLERLAPARDEARLWRALAIAAERRGDLGRADDALTRALERGESSEIRLERGALRARRGQLAAARGDLALAGDRFEARWNRAALSLIEAVGAAPGLPDPAIMGAARRDAHGTSGEWCDPTIGRLLWSLLIERADPGALAAGEAPAATARVTRDSDALTLRAAEVS
ncbi:MAG TPA: hypothetical protein VL123_01590 [Candidatus Udaeobacter sp.]|nr:hypothetical protein [Candidatus Udaeobacter sp.]